MPRPRPLSPQGRPPQLRMPRLLKQSALQLPHRLSCLLTARLLTSGLRMLVPLRRPRLSWLPLWRMPRRSAQFLPQRHRSL